jgi:acyl-CoA reductase-like NAD-dependent aldehyde dehydrogenase
MTADSRQNFVNGRWREAPDWRSLPMIDPAAGRSFGQIADRADVDAGVGAARTATGRCWMRTSLRSTGCTP